MQYLLISKKKWNLKNYKELDKKVLFRSNINQIFIKKKKPKIIFFLHWSKKIHKNIFSKNLCIQFHCSDLPHFKGGSPVQHQVLKGLKKTMLTSFRINNKIDSGDICLKKNISLKGNARMIYERIEKTGIKMINYIIKKKNIKFIKQKNKVKFYKRRKKNDSNLLSENYPKLENIYNFIRMLDAEGYPRAFLDFKNYKIFFKKAKLLNREIKGEFQIRRK